MSTQSTPLAATAISGHDLICVTVRDLQRSLAFYRDGIGLIPASGEGGGAEFHLPDGTTFGLWQPPAGSGFEPGLSVMFAVGDARAATARFREHGATIDDPFETPVCIMAIATDPEGNRIILHQKKRHDPHQPPAHAVTLTSIEGIDWYGYLVSDGPKAAAYYRDTFALTPALAQEGASGAGSEFTLADGSTFGVWHEHGAPNGGAVMFAVADARAKVAELRARGIEIGDAEEGDQCFMAIAADPDGVGVVIHQRK